MKLTSELIRDLQRSLQENGDLPVALVRRSDGFGGVDFGRPRGTLVLVSGSSDGVSFDGPVLVLHCEPLADVDG